MTKLEQETYERGVSSPKITGILIFYSELLKSWMIQQYSNIKHNRATPVK